MGSSGDKANVCIQPIVSNSGGTLLATSASEANSITHAGSGRLHKPQLNAAITGTCVLPHGKAKMVPFPDRVSAEDH